MRRFIFFILLIAITASGQYYVPSKLNTGREGYDNALSVMRVGYEGGFDLYRPSLTYCVQAQNFFERVKNAGKTLTLEQKNWYNDSIFVPLINEGIYDSIVFLHIRVTSDSLLSNTNLISELYNTIGYGGVVYTDSGAIGNGSTAYLNTFFNPTTDSTIAKMNSIGLGVVTRGSDATVRRMDIGGNLYALWLSWEFYSSAPVTRLNSSGTAVAFTSSGYSGILSASRMSSNFQEGYKNGVSIGTSSEISITKNNTYIFIMADNEGGAARFSPRTYLGDWVTSGLSNNKSNKLHNIINEALKDKGYNAY